MSYLTLKANDASISSTFTPDWLTIGTDGMQYRAVGATGWTNATAGVAISVDTVGIELKADTIKTTYAYHLTMTGSISASGDVTSLTNGVGGDCTLNDECYWGMFKDCTSLTTAPALPTTTLAERCYRGMFNGCTSLTTPPTLPATTLSIFCYCYMFANCSSLIIPPELPATTLAYRCYEGMFSNCTSLMGYITAEPGYTVIHNHPTTSVVGWNTDMYSGINAVSTVPATPSSGVNYYFKPASQPTTITGKRLECFGHDQHEITF